MVRGSRLRFSVRSMNCSCWPPEIAQKMTEIPSRLCQGVEAHISVSTETVHVSPPLQTRLKRRHTVPLGTRRRMVSAEEKNDEDEARMCRVRGFGGSLGHSPRHAGVGGSKTAYFSRVDRR